MIIFILCVLFTALFYIGNRVLLNFVSITSENNWKYRVTLSEIFITPAVGLCFFGYCTFLVVQFLIKKSGFNYNPAFIGLISFLLFASIFIFFLGQGIILSDTYTIKNLIVIAVSGYFAAVIQKLAFKKFMNQQ